MSAYIVFPTLLQAQRGFYAVSRKGIPAQVVKAPRSLEEKGCAYALRLAEKWRGDAVACLSDDRIRHGRVFVRRGEEYREAEE